MSVPDGVTGWEQPVLLDWRQDEWVMASRGSRFRALQPS